jgi:hypothetical protein
MLSNSFRGLRRYIRYYPRKTSMSLALIDSIDMLTCRFLKISLPMTRSPDQKRRKRRTNHVFMFLSLSRYENLFCLHWSPFCGDSPVGGRIIEQLQFWQRKELRLVQTLRTFLNLLGPNSLGFTLKKKSFASPNENRCCKFEVVGWKEIVWEVEIPDCT